MAMSRRSLLAAAAGSLPLILTRHAPATAGNRVSMEELDRVASGPLLDLSDLGTIDFLER